MCEPKLRTAGTARSSWLASTVMRSISSTPVPGLVMKCMRKSVSWNSGRNSEPKRVAAAPLASANAASTTPSAANGRRTRWGSAIP